MGTDQGATGLEQQQGSPGALKPGSDPARVYKLY